MDRATDGELRCRYRPGDVVDGFTVGPRMHEGGNGYLFHVTAPADRDPGFPLLMKVPAIGPGEPAISIVGFEVEEMILPMLRGRAAPRVVATGDLLRSPYIVMERIDGESLAAKAQAAPLPPDEVARIGAAIADALVEIHAQDVVHLDVKPENVMLRADGSAVFLDFGFSQHARLPDLLAEEQRYAAGSAAYVSPEQLSGRRNDPRSDIFALGAVLYELATGETPFGEPATIAGMRDRMWREPEPPRALNPDIPPWLQEVILRCLHPKAERRYPSASVVAFDLHHPDSVSLTERSTRSAGPGFTRHFGRWWRHWREATAPETPRPARAAPVILVAVDTEHPDDPRHPALQAATRNVIAMNPESRLICVSVIRAPRLGEGDAMEDTASGKHLEHVTRLKRWVEPLRHPAAQSSLHAVESGNAVDTLLDLAHANHVDLIVLGAPSPEQARLAWWRSVASGVTANARCSVYVVRVPTPNDDAADSR